MAGVQISPQIEQLAQKDSQLTHLQTNVILAQWQAEEGVQSTSQWVGNNPAGITPGNPHVDALANGLTPGGFDSFPDPATGALAYATLINTDPNYAIIRQAAKQYGTKPGADVYELAAISSSKWDAAHYTSPGGYPGDKLDNAYIAVTGGTIGQQAQQAATNAIKKAITGGSGGTGSGLASFLGLGSMSGWSLLIVIAGIVLAVVLSYRVVTN